MIEIIPKLADVKFLRELSKVIILPMLIAAYLIQSEFTIFGIFVDVEATTQVQTFQFISIFLMACLSISFLLTLLNELLLYLHLFTNFTALQLLATGFLAFGFIGVYGYDAPVITNLNNMWFYAAFVLGFYILAKAADIDSL